MFGRLGVENDGLGEHAVAEGVEGGAGLTGGRDGSGGASRVGGGRAFAGGRDRPTGLGAIGAGGFNTTKRAHCSRSVAGAGEVVSRKISEVMEKQGDIFVGCGGMGF